MFYTCSDCKRFNPTKPMAQRSVGPASMLSWLVPAVAWFDVVVVWRFDRFARSVKQLVRVIGVSAACV